MLYLIERWMSTRAWGQIGWLFVIFVWEDGGGGGGRCCSFFFALGVKRRTKFEHSSVRSFEV